MKYGSYTYVFVHRTQYNTYVDEWLCRTDICRACDVSVNVIIVIITHSYYISYATKGAKLIE